MLLSAQPVNTLDELRDKIAQGTYALTDDRVLIMGAGNVLMGDEGIGPTALTYLFDHFDFPENVALLDVGTTGLGMLPNIEDSDHLIIIDAANDSGHPAGTVIFYTPEDLADQQVMHSAHDQRLTDVLFAAKMTGVELKSVVVVGIQIESLEQFVLELSQPVQTAVPIACAAALHCLRELGFEATQKPDAEVDPALLDALQNYAPETE